MCDMLSLPAFEALGGGPDSGPYSCVAHNICVLTPSPRLTMLSAFGKSSRGRAAVSNTAVSIAPLLHGDLVIVDAER